MLPNPKPVLSFPSFEFSDVLLLAPAGFERKGCLLKAQNYEDNNVTSLLISLFLACLLSPPSNHD